MFNEALLQLANRYNYLQINPTDCTPEEVASVCYEIYVSWLTSECGIMDVRQSPNYACLLEKQVNGDWETFADLSQCQPLLRHGEDGIMEWSPDGGTTWHDIIAAPIPPVPYGGTGTNRCLAAASATLVIETTYEEFRRLYNENYSFLVALGLILSLLATLIFYPPAMPLVVAFATELWALWSSLGSIPFSQEARDNLRCILYCASVEDTGVVTFDHSTVVTKIQALMGGTPDIYWAVQYILAFIYPDGLDRAGATGVVTTADCQDCDCAESEELVIPSNGAFIPFTFIDGREYTITTTGAFEYGLGQTADAVAVEGQILAYYALNWGLTEAHVQNARLYPTSPINWETHAYTRSFTGDGQVHYFYIMDDEAEYGNNSGSLNILIEWDTSE